uniref:VASt domain-containing protein n=1 Tax=Tetradesmus obliquus TaxID=3088 RepID=A0A383WNN4_TETOB|eukprot:jgi/Sobl393_1/5270/SZX79070.1
MRELTFQAVIAGCSTKDFFRIAVEDSSVIRQFHIEANKDDTVTASDWDEAACTRVVCFTLAMAIPASVKRFVGAEPIRIKEKQSYEWLEGDTLKIVSIPIVQISLAKSLSTRAELLISNSSEGCQIDVTVSVSASVPWPMTSTVEALMADEAKRTVGQYVDYITKYVEGVLQQMNNEAAMQQQLQQVQQQEAPQAIEVAAAALAAVEELEAEQQQQQQQQQLAALAPAKQPATPPAAGEQGPPAVVWADARSAAPRAQLQPRTIVPAAASAVAAEDADVFFDASEGSTAVLEAMLRELKQAQAARQEANRLLLSIKDSVQQLERTVGKEVAFQEGVRYGQRLGAGSLLLSVAAAAAAASAATAFILARQQSRK